MRDSLPRPISMLPIFPKQFRMRTTNISIILGSLVVTDIFFTIIVVGPTVDKCFLHYENTIAIAIAFPVDAALDSTLAIYEFVFASAALSTAIV